MTSRLRRWIKQHVAPAVLVLLIVCSFRSAIADWNLVPTGSMNPTIVEGDRILVNKLAFGVRVPFTMWHLAQWSEPRRGDVVVFHSPMDGQRMVKRVVAVPGDTVLMIDNLLNINGQPANITLAAPGVPVGGQIFATERLAGGGAPHSIVVTPALPSRRDFAPVTVPADHYFVLGDNRDNSGDSRYFGFVPRDSITGRSSRVLYSLDAKDWYLPRWQRTLEPLP